MLLRKILKNAALERHCHLATKWWRYEESKPLFRKTASQQKRRSTNSSCTASGDDKSSKLSSLNITVHSTSGRTLCKRRMRRESDRVKQWWQTSLARLVDTQLASGSALSSSSPRRMLAVARSPLPLPGLTKRSSLGAIATHVSAREPSTVYIRKRRALRHDVTTRTHIIGQFPP